MVQETLLPEADIMASRQQGVARWGELLDAMPSCIYWKSRDGVYLGCNDAVLQTLSLTSKDAILGKTDYDLWPTRADAIRRNDLLVLEHDKPLLTEEAITLPHGECLYFVSSKAPLKDQAGQTIGVIGNALNVTSLKLKTQSAEAVSHAKMQFLALMSHELRIPLVGIISTASMLVESEITLDEAREFGKIISDSGNYLLSTIDNILDFAKFEAKKFSLVINAVDLKKLVEEVTAILRSSAKEKGLELFVFCDPKLPSYIDTDSRVVRHILTNLISNAIKFTDKGYIVVEIHQLEQGSQATTLQITVRDTGIGIPPDKLDRIFDTFSQIENPYQRRTSRQGTGLGLSIVKKLVALLQGAIDVKSEVDQGTVFTVQASFPTALGSPP